MNDHLPGMAGVEGEVEGGDVGSSDSAVGDASAHSSMSKKEEAVKHADIVKSLHAHLREEVDSGVMLSLVSWGQPLC